MDDADVKIIDKIAVQCSACLNLFDCKIIHKSCSCESFIDYTKKPMEYPTSIGAGL